MALPDIQKLALEIQRSDPRDSRQQALLHERILQLRNELGRAYATDLAAYLDSAAHLTDYLIHMGRIGPEEVLEIVARLVSKVSETFELPQAREPLQPLPAAGHAHAHAPADLPARSDEKLLGEIMVQLGHVTQKQLDQGLVAQRATDQRIGEALVGIGAATWSQVKEAVAVQRQLRSAIPLDARR